jgi:hypothetical protein
MKVHKITSGRNKEFICKKQRQELHFSMSLRAYQKNHVDSLGATE